MTGDSEIIFLGCSFSRLLAALLATIHTRQLSIRMVAGGEEITAKEDFRGCGGLI